MARRALVAGNWKLNLTPSESAAVATALRDRVADRGNVDVLLFPTALSIPSTLDALQGSGIETGIQNVYARPKGAFTGANSAFMARTIGCAYALAGHSERRHVFGESDEAIGASVRAALDVPVSRRGFAPLFHEALIQSKAVGQRPGAQACAKQRFEIQG